MNFAELLAQKRRRSGDEARAKPEKFVKVCAEKPLRTRELQASEQKKPPTKKARFMQSEYISEEFTPNEVTQLAICAKSDNSCMLELWKSVERLVYSKAKAYTNNTTNRFYDIDDLIQQGYIALSDAVCTYEPKGMQFTGWLYFYLQRAFKYAAGHKTDAIRYTQDTVTEDKSGDKVDLMELIEDEEAAKSLSDIEDNAAAIFLIERINALPDKMQSECILAAAAGEKRNHVAERLQITYNDVIRHTNHARWILQKDKLIKAAYPERYCWENYRKGYGAFNTSWSSVVEDVIIRMEQIHERDRKQG